MYCIIKVIKNDKGVFLPVVMLDSSDEVWEFESREEAENITQILQKNSDSGYVYSVKKV